MSLTEPFRVKAYLHSDKDTMHDQVVRAIGESVYRELSDVVQRKLTYLLYEVEFELNVDPLTGDYRIISIKDCNQVIEVK